MTRHCEHVKANGHFCKSPAMRGRNYCYFHLNLAGQRLRAQQLAARGADYLPELPPLEDAASIQLALMQVNEWLLRGTIDYKRAGLLLYSLQTASCNLRNMQTEAEADAKASTAICSRYDSFEQDYELDEESAAGLRLEEPSEGPHEPWEEVNSAAILSSQEQPNDAAPTDEDGSDRQTAAPHRQRPLMLRDEDFQIPIMLSEEQFLQAKCAIFQYRLDHNLDAKDERLKVIPQRAAISQKIFQGARKPVASVRLEEESGQSSAAR